MADRFVVAPAAPPRFSMSFIRRSQQCLRLAHLEREADVSGADALIGKLFHEIAATVGFVCVMRDRRRADPREVVRIARRTLAHPEEAAPLPKDVWEQVLELVRRWAPTARFRPGACVEVNSRQELAGRVLSARLDVEAVDGATVHIEDYKTGWARPARELPVQGEVYAWHAHRRHADAQRIVYTEHHVRFGVRSGPHVIYVDDLADVEAWLLDNLQRLESAYASGDQLPTQPGPWCRTSCPDPRGCPLPEWARPASTVVTEDDAVAQFEAMLAEEARIAERKKVIRAWLEAESRRALALGGEEVGWADKPGTRLDETAVARAGVDLNAYRVESPPSFGRRRARSRT